MRTLCGTILAAAICACSPSFAKAPCLAPDSDDWGSSRWIVHPREHDGAYEKGECAFAGSYRFRRRFTVPADKTVVRAVASVCGLGAYRLYLNGACADRSYLSPGWSEYLDKIRYDRIDVTKLVTEGTNVVEWQKGSV